MTAMRETSLDAFESIQKELGRRQLEVLMAIENLEKPNLRDIAEYLHLPINSVTGRVNELVKFKLVSEGGKKIDSKTKRNTIWWIKNG